MIDCYQLLLTSSSSPSSFSSSSSPPSFTYRQKIQALYYVYLQTFEEEVSSTPESIISGTTAGNVIDTLSKCAISYLGNSIYALNVDQDFLSKKGIQSLGTLNNKKLLFDLVTILAHGNVHDFLAFSQTNNKFFESEPGLQYSVILNNIRLLTLASMANKADDNSLTYDAIAKELDIDIDEVEQWVVDAITAELIDGQMDQIQGTLQITKSKARGVDQTTFEKLKKTVQGWKISVEKMSEVVQSGKSN